MAISVVSVAAVLEMENGKCKKARISLGAVAPKPLRAYGVEEMLEGEEITENLIGACCEHVQREINPITDIRASAEYRRQMSSVLLRRLLREVTQSQSAALGLVRLVYRVVWFVSLRETWDLIKLVN
jgi:carbon-monoxide dehydrogenase medium subunit